MTEVGDHGITEKVPQATDEERIEAEDAAPQPQDPVTMSAKPATETETADVTEVDSIAKNTQTLRIDTAKAQDDIKDLPASPPPPQPPSDQDKPYIDPTPKTPTLSRFNSRKSLQSEKNEANKEAESTAVDQSQEKTQMKEGDNESSSEIQSILEQFAEGVAAPSKEAIMSPKLETTTPLLETAAAKFPPRRSSLEPLRSRDMDVIAQSPVTSISEKHAGSPPPVPPKSGSIYPGSPLQPNLTGSSMSLPKQLPEPEPEPELPFDFHRFLEQLRHKSADPVAKFLRSFLNEFGKKQWMVHEQVKIISDFLSFITNKMALCEVWREVSDNEFDNAKEGMEKLVMNRLYSQTFSPVIPAPPQSSRGRAGKRKDSEKVLGPGRRGQHQEDVERDEILAQKIRIYSWVKEEHLDIAPVDPNGERFLRLAQQELLKIKGYRAPRDKVICILNCCKVIFGLLKNASTSDTSADSFVPLLIFVVLQSNPEHLISNIQYILRFRNQDKLSGEAGYYLSSLSGAVQFVESLDRTTLTVSDEDFERHVELAVSAIAEQNREKELASPRPRLPERPRQSESIITPRTSLDVPSSSPRKSTSREGKRGSSANNDGSDDEPGVTGLLRTIQKPLSTIGRIFSDQDVREESRSEAVTPARRLSPAVFQIPATDASKSSQNESSSAPVASYDAQEAAARQASAEAAEARRIQRAEHKTVVDTLCGMFPNLDRDIIDDVVRQKQGRVGLAVDACLSLTASG